MLTLSFSFYKTNLFSRPVGSRWILSPELLFYLLFYSAFESGNEGPFLKAFWGLGRPHSHPVPSSFPVPTFGQDLFVWVCVWVCVRLPMCLCIHVHVNRGAHGSQRRTARVAGGCELLGMNASIKQSCTLSPPSRLCSVSNSSYSSLPTFALVFPCLVPTYLLSLSLQLLIYWTKSIC